MIRTIGAGFVLALAGTAHASGQFAALNHLDGYYVLDAEIEVGGPLGSGKDDGDGFGVKTTAQITDAVFFVGEYQSIETDDASLELDQLRIGLGFVAPINHALTLVPRIEMLRAKLDAPGVSSSSETGVGFHGAALLQVAPQLVLQGGIGYVTELDNFSGPEYHIGARFLATPDFSLFVDYRATRLSDSGEDLDISDLRIGAGFHF